MGACGSNKNALLEHKSDTVPQTANYYTMSMTNLFEIRQTFQGGQTDIFEHYTDREIILLNKLFVDLATRSPNDTISKETFLEYFELPGILGDRLFAVFDYNHNEVIDFQEFLSGLTRYNHGELADKIEMLFEIYDMDGDNEVNREELSLIINTVLTPTTSLFYSKEEKQHDAEHKKINKSTSIANLSISAITQQTVEQMVDEAFKTCDTNHSGKLSKKQFTVWVKQHPAALQMLETVLAKHIWSSAEHLEDNEQDSDLNLASAMSMLRSVSHTSNELGRCGVLYIMDPKTLHKYRKKFIQLYYVVKDKFLYTFRKEADASPIKVIFIAGWYINAVDDKHAKKGWHGIEMTPPTFINDMKRKKMLYTKTKTERNEWIKSMQKAAATLSISQYYDIGEILGRTHFSVVCLGTHKKTGERYAIKIVDKSCIQSRERLNLRNEIAMMKLVNHPSIMRMQDVFADPNSIYMVMTLAPYGDFFQRWKKRRIFEEDIARIIIYKLLDACQYLHSLGIVHRDLKPENILCLDANDDTQIVISDFGLSKFASPHMQMTMPCGTLCYVAPEVLAQAAYGKKVDIWSIGCIMHLLLRGVLPFDGYTEQQIREKTLHKTLNLKHAKWAKISDDAKDVVKNMLIKDPTRRMSVKDALQHRWFDKLKEDQSNAVVIDKKNNKEAQILRVNLL